MANTKVTGELIADNAIKAVHIDETATGITLADLSVTGGLTVDTNTLVVDAANNAVGVGTTSVTGTYGKLSVAGGMRILDDSNAKLEIGRYSAAASNSYIKMGANSNSLRFTDHNDQFDLVTIQNDGNVGIGTSSPTGQSADNRVLQIYGAGTANRAQIHLCNSNTGEGTNDGSFIGIDLNKDLFINNAESANIIFEGAGSERMRITSGGDLLVGATTVYGAGGLTVRQSINASDYKVSIDGGLVNSAKCLNLSSGLLNGTHGMMTLGVSNPGDGRFITFTAPDGGYNYQVRGAIALTGTTVQYASFSDYRLKENVVPLTRALDRVDLLKPSRFNFKGDDETVDGFLAHEVQEIVPQAVLGKKDEVDEEGNPIYQGIDQSKITPLLTAAIKELKALLEAQQAEIELLKSGQNG